MSYSINKWDSVVNKYNKLSPIIYFKTDKDFLEASRRNSNFLQIKITGTNSIYDKYQYIFATVDKSPVEGYYCMTLEVPFDTIPITLGHFELNKGVYSTPQIALSTAGEGEEVTPSPDYSKQNEEAYNKIMNAVKIVTVITVLASAAAISMQGAATTAAVPSSNAAATTTKGTSKLPVAGVGFSTKMGGQEPAIGGNHTIIERTKDILISVFIFLGIGYILTTFFGVKPNLNFSA
jgi:hypothetical protein